MAFRGIQKLELKQLRLTPSFSFRFSFTCLFDLSRIPLYMASEIIGLKSHLF